MKAIYLDVFSGISGDMFIGALIDLGVNAAELQAQLRKLNVSGYHVDVSRGIKSGITGTKFDVHVDTAHHQTKQSPEHLHHAKEHSHSHAATVEPHGRTFSNIRTLIAGSALSDWVKAKAIAVFSRIAVAEGKIHGRPPEQVHFHEVGAVDSIVDIVGACICLEHLGRPALLSGPVIEGTGWIDCAHGRLPIPAPATLEILSSRGVTISQCDEPHELVTPTGAALLAEFAETFGPMADFAVAKIGYGLGSRQNKTRPNVLRVVLGDRSMSIPEKSMLDWETDSVAVLETNLDDVSPEILGDFVERALAAGALDVFHTPIHMKKNRSGVLLTVLCETGHADKFSEMILRETTAFGVRHTQADRRKLKRQFVSADTVYGAITVKVGTLNGTVVQAAPEFESCRKAASQAGVPLKKVYQAATQAFEQSKT